MKLIKIIPIACLFYILNFSQTYANVAHLVYNPINLVISSIILLLVPIVIIGLIFEIASIIKSKEEKSNKMKNIIKAMLLTLAIIIILLIADLYVYSFGISDGWSPLFQTKFVPNEIATIISYFMRIVALIMIVCYIARTVKNIKNKDIAKKDKIKNITNELIIILIIICVILYFAPVVGRIGGKEEPNTMPSFVLPY